MRRMLLGALAALCPIAAGAAEYTIVDGGGATRTEADPYAPAPAPRGRRETVGALLAPGVALFVEPAEGASPHVSNLLAGALVRRFGGHVPAAQALAAGRVVTARAALSEETDGATVVTWRFRDERGQVLAVAAASRRMADEATARDAESIALQIAAQLEESAPFRRALTLASAVARLDRTPSPARRPGGGEEGEVGPTAITAGPPAEAAAPVARPDARPRPAERHPSAE